jgi:predicted HTH domain antitoxin
MSIQITMDLPEEIFATLKYSPDMLAQEMRLASAVKWYEMGLLSQAKAAELSGLSRQVFIESLARFSVSPFQVNP